MATSDTHDTIDGRAGALPATRHASPTGLTVAGLGVVVLNVSPFLNWVDPQGPANPRTGYETDSLVPFMAYLGIGLLLAMVYAGKRARRGQHRGLTLVSMAVGVAAAIQCTAFAINPMGGLERGDHLAPQIGVFIGIIGAAIWAIGSGLLAKEIEGDDDRIEGHLTTDAQVR
jgi:peptidoglycan/LPS O-acetylase OafA/YrhL